MNHSQGQLKRRPSNGAKSESQANIFLDSQSQKNSINSHNSINKGNHPNSFSKKMMKVINGKMVSADQEEAFNLRPGQNQRPQTQGFPEPSPSVQGKQTQQRNIGTASSKNCEAKGLMESEVDSFININDVYYKHIKGLCICYKCTCGKHKCAWIKNSHPKQPYNSPPQQSIYKINYGPKKGIKGIDFDYGMYNNMKTNTNTIDQKSINHQDYTKPELSYYGANPSFKPEAHVDHNPPQVGRSHYKRDFLEWGCAPYQPIKGNSQRTTIESMPFHGLTTYTKDYHKMDCNREPLKNNNHGTTMLKSPIPFLGITTSQEFYKPYKDNDKAVRYKASDELITGAPSFKGQFSSLNQKDYINYLKRCPVEIDIEREKLTSQGKSS